MRDKKTMPSNAQLAAAALRQIKRALADLGDDVTPQQVMGLRRAARLLETLSKRKRA